MRSRVVLAWVVALFAAPACSVLEPTYQAARDDGSPGAVIEVVFEGNAGVAAGQLRREIEDYMRDLSRDPTRRGMAFDAAEDLADLYRALGYPEATVDYEIARVSPERVVVTFRIHEGPLAVVDEIRFDGNQSISSEELTALWQRQHSGLLGLGKPLLVEAELQSLAADAGRLYRNRGFLDVDVQPPVIEREAGTGTGTAHITISEGDRYDFGSVDLAPELAAETGPDAPAPPSGVYSPREVQDYALALRSHLRHKGFPDPELRGGSRPDRETRRVQVQIEGTPGRRATVAAIEVRGNDQTRTSLILDRLGIEPGTRYDGAAEDTGLRRLYLSGLFTKVRIDREWIDDEHLRLVVNVDEDDSRSAEIMTGYGSYERLRGGVRIEERNLFGAGVHGALLGRVSQRGYRAGASVTEPHLLGSETSLTVSTEFFEREEPSFTDEAFGATVSLSRPLFPRLVGRVGYSFRDHADAQAQVVDPGSRFVDFTEGRLFAELKSDFRDNPLFPKSGHEEFLLVEAMDDSLGSDVSFLRVRGGLTLHLQLSDATRLVLRTEQGVLWPQDGSADIPLQERFFNGGESTVRSFRESRLGPVDSAGTPIGGEYRNIFSAELRTPLWKTLEGSVFADAGNVGSSVDAFGFANMGYAVGLGLRLVLPIGPIRVDGAYNPDRDPNEKEWVVHFSVGYPF